MKIVYIGTVEFSYHCLVEVLKNNGEVTGIITSKNNKFNSDYQDPTPIAKKHNIPIYYCKNINSSATLEWIKNKKPDILFCFGWSQLLKKEILSIAPMGCLGVHPALIPKNRGRHPIIWSLALGLKESGLTFFFIDEGADSGPILSQRTFNISNQDNARTIIEKIKKLASFQISEFLPQLISGSYKTVPQNPEKATYWRKRSPKDGLIDWRMHSDSILNLIRALTKPYPGAQFIYEEAHITVWAAHEFKEKTPENIEPGKIIQIENRKPVIKCYNSAIVIDEHEPRTVFTEGEYIK